MRFLLSAHKLFAGYRLGVGMRLLFTIFLSFWVLAAHAQEEIPATPRHRSPPAYPVSCQQVLGPDAPPQYVSVVFDVTRNGETDNVRIRETSHECFNDAVVAAARQWSYAPRQVNGRRASQEDLEVTLTFILEEPTQTEDFDARPLQRVPPVYPESCMRTADREESVMVEFDVTPEGDTENVSVLESSNRCLNGSAVASVKKWKYRPKIIEGGPVARKNVQTVITYFLDSGRSRFRPGVSRRLIRAQNLIVKKDDPEAALEVLKEVEERFGDDFSDRELSAFHQVRGLARIKLEDYAGALDDFRIVRQLGAGSEDGLKAINETIAELERALGVSPVIQSSESAEDAEPQINEE